MARTKRVSAKCVLAKREASSSHSFQDDDLPPRKAIKAEPSDEGSPIEMINSKDLRKWRKKQEQERRLSAAQQDDDDDDESENPPAPSRRPRQKPHFGLIPRREQPVEDDEDEEDEEEEYHTSYGGNTDAERNQRIGGWVGGLAGTAAGATSPDNASLQPSSPSASGNVVYTDDEYDPEGEGIVAPCARLGTPRTTTRAAGQTRLLAQTRGASASLRHHRDPNSHLARGHVNPELGEAVGGGPVPGSKRKRVPTTFKPYGKTKQEQDSDVQVKEEPESEDDDSVNDMEEAGSAGSDARSASENGGQSGDEGGDEDDAADGDDEAGSASGDSSPADENMQDGSDDEDNEEQESEVKSENESDDESAGEDEDAGESESSSENDSDDDGAANAANNAAPNLYHPPPAIPYVDHFAQPGGLPDIPFAGPQTRQNTALNSSRNQPLAPGQGFAQIPIAEQQAAQLLHAWEGVESEDGEGEVEDGEVEGEDAEDQGEDVKDEDVKAEDVKAEDADVE